MGKRVALTVWLLIALMLAGVVWMGYVGVERERMRVPLLEAAGKQNTAEVQRLLNAGADPNARDTVLWHRSAWAAFLDRLYSLRRHQHSAPEIGPTALMIAAAGERIKPTPPDPMRSDAENSEWQTPGLWPLRPAGDDPEAVRLLLDRGADVNARGADGWTALMSAANVGHAQTVRLLIKRGASLNVTWQGYTPLMRAIGSYGAYRCPGCRQAAQVLIDAGADVNAGRENTPLMEAVESGDIGLVRLLLDRGAKINGLPHDGDHSTPLTAAISYGDIDNPARSRGDLRMARFLLARGADINGSPQALLTPLTAAAVWRQDAMLHFLLTHGADVNAPSADGNTALIWAANKGRLNIVSLLIEHKANINAVNHAGHTALHLAADQGSISVMRVLLDYGANPNIQDKEGKTPLIKVMEANRDVRESAILAGLRLLLAHGADVNLPNRSGLTPLMCSGMDEPSLNLLLAHGADVNARALDGHTVLMQAAQEGSLGVVRLLLTHGAALEAHDSLGQTPLMYAAEGNYTDTVAVIRLLLAHGAALQAHDNKGATALMFAEDGTLTKEALGQAQKEAKKGGYNGLK